MLDQPQLHQQTVQGAEISTIDPTPHRAIDDGWHRPWNNQAETQKLPTPGT
jgi:hypothetical protein